jgi:4-hydroxybenzoate polyprenyltransferase
MISSMPNSPRPTIGEKPMPAQGLLPLCVDLDGTLLQTDTLHEGLMQLLRRQPLRVVQLLLAVGRGKAIFKQAVTRATALDPATLPMNEDLLAYLHAQKAAGRPLALFSAADKSVVGAVADHLGLFEYAQGSDGTTNLSGADKLAAIRKRYGDDFIYAGNARVDLPIWLAAKGAIAVTSDDNLASDAANLVPLEARIRPHGGGAAAWLKALRPHQWAKNLLLFVPILLAGPLATIPTLLQAALGLLIFNLLASAGYVVNDLLDLDSDRRHPTKRHRPFAAGRISIQAGVLSVGVLLALAMALLPLMPFSFVPVALGYFAGTLAYSLALKREPILDVLGLAGLFTVRVLAGAVLVPLPVSFWLLSFSMFMFLSLALVKRHAELAELAHTAATTVIPGRGYTGVEQTLLLVIGVSTAIAANIIFLIYLIDEKFPSNLYAQPECLWLIFPLLMFWLMRLWRLTVLERMHEDPVFFALRDRLSLVIGAVVFVIVLLAR